MRPGLGGLHARVGDHDHLVARLHQPRGRAVDPDDPAAPRRLDDIGGEARARGDVEHVHLLVRQEGGGVQEVAVDGDGAFVLEVGLGHGRPMQLGAQHGEQHGDGIP